LPLLESETVQFSGLHLLTVNRRNTGTITTVGSSEVEKKFTPGDRVARVEHLRVIYHLLKEKRVPNVDELQRYYSNSSVRGSVVYLRPKGMDDSPRREQEVKEALICILEALVVCVQVL
jgi:hypothetical protein